MIIRLPEPLPDGAEKEMYVTDEGQTWGWECDKCDQHHSEDDPLAEGDLLICENCGERYRCE